MLGKKYMVIQYDKFYQIPLVFILLKIDLIYIHFNYK
jgi:hypothetical protein